MVNSFAMTVVGAIALTPSGGQQSAQEVLETVRARQLERSETVDNYTVFQRLEGVDVPGVSESGALEVPTHYQKHDIDGEPAFGVVPGNEYLIAVAQAGEQGEYVNAEFFELAAEGSVMTADAMEAEMSKSGAPPLPGLDSPGQMMRDNALFAEASADAIREAEAGDFGRASAAATLAATKEMAGTMRLVGREQVDGRDAFHLRVEGLDRVLTEPGVEPRFTLRSASMWVDAEHYVTLRTFMEGDAEADGQKRSVTIEQLYEDYRSVGPLYESHRQVMRLSGVMADMDPDQRKELEESMRKIEELEAQLAQMPEATRGMMEGQIERAKAQLGMLTGDGFELVSEVLRIEINTGPPPPGTLHRAESPGQAERP